MVWQEKSSSASAGKLEKGGFHIHLKLSFTVLRESALENGAGIATVAPDLEFVFSVV